MHKKWFYYGIAGGASILYLTLSSFTPPAPSAGRLGLSQEQIFFLRLSIAIPYIITWIFAMYSLYTLDRYIQSVKKKSDNILTLLRSFHIGLFWVALGTICVGLIGVLRSYFIANTTVYPPLTIIMNYLYVLPSLIGFFIMYRGVLKLRSSKELFDYKPSSFLFNTLIVVCIAIFYLLLLFTNPARQFSPDPVIPATYYLPDILIVATLVVPIIAAWWLGFYVAFAVGDLVPYLTRAEFFKGISRILYGIWAIIFTSILIQSLLSLGTERLLAIGLGLLLLLIYVFVILQGIGYFFLAFGANALFKSMKEGG